VLSLVVSDLKHLGILCGELGDVLWQIRVSLLRVRVGVDFTYHLHAKTTRSSFNNLVEPLRAV
jgi:hypothetical protein